MDKPGKNEERLPHLDEGRLRRWEEESKKTNKDLRKILISTYWNENAQEVTSKKLTEQFHEFMENAGRK